MSRPLYIDTPAGPVLGFHHPAAADQVGAGKAAVLFCAPWGWNETVSYRSRRTWAEALAAEGHPVLRFDLPAVGDSAGAPSDQGLLGSWIEAVTAAAEYLAGVEPGREIAVLGMEIGALLALEAARQGAPIDVLAMWAPPRDGRGFVRATRAFSRMQRWSGGPDGDSPLPEGWIEAAGFVLSAETVEALGELKPLEEAPPGRLRRALVLGRDEMAPEQALADHLASAGAKVEVAPGPGWEGMVRHPGYAVPPPPTMERFSRWLADGHPAGDTRTERAAVDDAQDEITLAVGDAVIREAPLTGLAAQTFGVLSEPDGGSESDECVIFLNAGAIRHIGPNRVWVDSARELAAAGVRSVRLDLAGIGEGEGESARFAEISEFYDPEFGKQIEAALTTIERSGPARRFTVIGLCSGGYWAFRIGIDDSRVEQIIPLNPGAFRWRHSLVMEQDGKGLSMLTEGRLWRKLFRGEFDLKKIRAFALLAVRRIGEKVRSLRAGAAGAAEEETRREPKLEADFDALREAGTEVTIAFSTDERPAEALRRSGIVAELGRWPNTSLVDLPGVDHAIASTSAQAAARELIRERILGERESATAPSSGTAPSLRSDVQAAAE